MKEEVPLKQEQIITDLKTLLLTLRKRIVRCITVQKTTTPNLTNLTIMFQHLAPTKSTMLQLTAKETTIGILNHLTTKDRTKLNPVTLEQNLEAIRVHEKTTLLLAPAHHAIHILPQVQALHAAPIQRQVQGQAADLQALQAVAVQVAAAAEVEAIVDNKEYYTWNQPDFFGFIPLK